MRKLCVVIFILAMASCKKDPVTTRRPVAYQPGQDSIDLPGNGLFEGDVDLNGITFIPSSKPLVFPSVAFGRDNGNGQRAQFPLSSSGWTHPSVVHFDVPWNGFTYWMAITPYPNTDNQFENPHIFGSNNGIDWQEPAGIINPIEPCPSGNAYNSDVNLIMDDHVLYCYFRVSGVLSGRAMYVVRSKDGVHWSQKELVCEWPSSGMDVIAPSVVKDGSLYHCFGICTGEAKGGVYYSNISIRKMVSSDPVTGFMPIKDAAYKIIQIDGRPWGKEQDPWHVEVKKLNKLWLMLVTTTNHGAYGGGGRLFLGYSTDGAHFVFGTKPLTDAAGTYKSSFFPSFDPARKMIKIELWRAMMSGGWTVYHDQFYVRTKPEIVV